MILINLINLLDKSISIYCIRQEEISDSVGNRPSLNFEKINKLLETTSKAPDLGGVLFPIISIEGL